MILVISLVSDATLTGVYLGFTVFLRNKFKKIFDECRIDFDGISNNYNPSFFIGNYKKALPIEIGLYDDLDTENEKALGKLVIIIYMGIIIKFYLLKMGFMKI